VQTGQINTLSLSAVIIQIKFAIKSTKQSHKLSTRHYINSTFNGFMSLRANVHLRIDIKQTTRQNVTRNRRLY